MITMSTALRSMPAAFRLVWNWPVRPLLRSNAASPVPVSITTSLPEVLTTIGLYGVVIRSLGLVRFLERLVEFLARLVGDVVVGELERVRAVGHHRDLDVADLVAIQTGVLFPHRGRGGVRA